jgi:hypothetical protein
VQTGAKSTQWCINCANWYVKCAKLYSGVISVQSSLPDGVLNQVSSVQNGVLNALTSTSSVQNHLVNPQGLVLSEQRDVHLCKVVY